MEKPVWGAYILLEASSEGPGVLATKERGELRRPAWMECAPQPAWERTRPLSPSPLPRWTLDALGIGGVLFTDFQDLVLWEPENGGHPPSEPASSSSVHGTISSQSPKLNKGEVEGGTGWAVPGPCVLEAGALS